MVLQCDPIGVKNFEFECELTEYKATHNQDTVAGKIHKQEFVLFWRETLKADAWTMHVLENGYALPFVAEPSPYFEPNNRSAMSHPDFVRKELEDMVQQQVIREVDEQPFCCSPLSVAERVKEDGTIAYRLCFDGSRHINKLLKKEKFRLSNFLETTELVSENDYLAVFDLKSSFYHVSIREEDQKYLGIAFFDQMLGKTRYFVYLTMPFGIATACFVLNRITRPLVAYIRSHGVKLALYLDDGRVNGPTKEDTLEQLQFCIQIFTKAGFIFLKAKTDTFDTISQNKRYLGFVMDTTTMKITLSDDKLQRIEQSFLELKAHDGRRVHAKVLASAIGKANASSPAFGSIMAVWLRSLYLDLESTVETNGWNSSVALSETSKKCISIILDNLRGWNGQRRPFSS